MRLDQYLFENNYFESRNKAVFSIKAGFIYINNKQITKSSYDVREEDCIEIKDEALAYVSKGGLKLEKALSHYQINVKDYICLDVGASTGGFTDCLLQNGAKKVYAIDTGTSQLHESLKNDKRVVSLEQSNFLTYDLNQLPNIDLIVIDVSFISVRLILERIIKEFKTFNAVVLIKPQFEVGKMYIKNGVIKDDKLHELVIKEIKTFLDERKVSYSKVIESPIKGGSGNKEYLINIYR